MATFSPNADGFPREVGLQGRGGKEDVFKVTTVALLNGMKGECCPAVECPTTTPVCDPCVEQPRYLAGVVRLVKEEVPESESSAGNDPCDGGHETLLEVFVGLLSVLLFGSAAGNVLQWRRSVSPREQERKTPATTVTAPLATATPTGAATGPPCPSLATGAATAGTSGFRTASSQLGMEASQLTFFLRFVCVCNYQLIPSFTD
jgi:hypothetical protein